MINEFDAGNIETYNSMNKCLREANYDADKAFTSYIDGIIDEWNEAV